MRGGRGPRVIEQRHDLVPEAFVLEDGTGVAPRGVRGQGSALTALELGVERDNLERSWVREIRVEDTFRLGCVAALVVGSGTNCGACGCFVFTDVAELRALELAGQPIWRTR